MGFENPGAVSSSDQSQILKDSSSFVSSSSQFVGDHATGILFQSDQASQGLKSDLSECLEGEESESMAASQVSDLPVPTITSQDPEAEFQPEGDRRPPRQDGEWKPPPPDDRQEDGEEGDPHHTEEWEDDETTDEEETPPRYGCRRTPATVPCLFDFMEMTLRTP